MNCPYCGHENSDDAIVCIFCLKDLEESRRETTKRSEHPHEIQKIGDSEELPGDKALPPDSSDYPDTAMDGPPPNKSNFKDSFPAEEAAAKITSEIAENYGWESTWDYRDKGSEYKKKSPHVHKDFTVQDSIEDAPVPESITGEIQDAGPCRPSRNDDDPIESPIEDDAPIRAEDFGWGRTRDYLEEKATERLLDERFIEEELAGNAQQISEEYIDENRSNEDNLLESLFESDSPIRSEDFGWGSSNDHYEEMEKIKESKTAPLLIFIVVALISILFFLAMISGIESCMKNTSSIKEIPGYSESSLCRNEPDIQGSGIALCGHTGIPTTYNSRVDHIFPLAKYNFQGAAFGI